MMLLDWLRKTPQESERIKVLRREPSKLRLQEWQSQPAMVKLAVELLGDKRLQLMLDVVRTEHPGNYVQQIAMPPEQRALIQAQCEGYTMALANLEALAQFQKPVEPLEATFEPAEKVE